MSTRTDEATPLLSTTQQMEVEHHPDNPGARAFDSCQLLDGGREVLIRHGSECYRLRHTRNDKLILTK